MLAVCSGTVLLSQATRELIELDVTELGEHRLKDFAEPVALYQLGAIPKRHNRDIVSGRRLRDDVPGELLCTRKSSWRRHAERGVEGDDGRAGGRGGSGGREERTGKRQREEHEGRDPQHQQRDLPEPARRGVLHRGIPQQRDRRELHPRLSSPLEQMQNDGDGRCQRANQKQWGEKGRH